ncbi:Vps62-related protein [Streptomyces sp. NEAU-S77]|uniref:Vps62-related protein n=1 Tax=Streptomyces sp. NEAU-S77 TaxID=3411033 RepID=UPI003BA03A5C
MNTARYGGLEIRVTSQFTLAWADVGSGADKNFAAYNVGGFGSIGEWKTLAQLGRPSFDDINGKVAAIQVRAVSPGDGLLRPPTGFTKIWGDHGTGSDKDGSVWRPVPPSGYVALGDVFVSGYNSPNPAQYACVRKDAVGGHRYVREARIGGEIWNDRGSGGDRDVSVWAVQAPPYPPDRVDRLIMGVDGFITNPAYSKPEQPVYVLDLPALVVKNEQAPGPVLTSHAQPVKETLQTVERVVTVPCTLVADPGRTPAWQVEHSPF